MTNPRLTAALTYLRERKWSVIPLHPQKKKAMVKWRPFARRLPTEDEVRDWWERYPKANVGVVTGAVSGIVVVDIDPDKGGDAEAWQQANPTALTSQTGRGGMHFYYLYPPNVPVVRNSAGKIAPGVDVRGDGGYVAAPPSKHPNGNNYAWIENGRPAAPPSLVPIRTSSLNGNGNGTHPEISTEHWLERTLKGVGHGERNDATAKLAGYFLSRKIPTDVVLEQLLTWNKQNDPPLPASEIKQTVESVARTAAENRKHAPTFQLEREQADEDEEGGLYDTIGLGAYLAKYGSTPLTWLVKDWLPAQTVGMVVAPPGSYKTWLLQDLAVSVATGVPFLGKFPVERKGPVLFMQQEDWHGQIAHRFALIVSRRFGITPPRMIGDDLHVHYPPEVPVVLHEQRRFKFEDAEVVEAWIDKIKRIRPALVILDPLYSAGSVEDFMAGTARSMFLFKSIRDALGTAFLIAHHTRKSSRPADNGNGNARRQAADNAPEREDVWGSQFLNAWMETGWQIRKREEIGTATIVRHFKVQSDAQRAVLGFKIDTTTVPGKYDVEVQDVKPGEQAESGADLVAILETKGMASVNQLAEQTGLHRSTIHRRLQSLLKAGVVVLHGSKYALTPNLEVQNG